MTFCKQLASAQRDDDTITAWEMWDKGSILPRYEITVSKDGIARLVFPTAKTTWKKKFKYLADIT